MEQQGPAVVGLYFREAGRWRRIAEFRLATDGHVTFRAVDPVEGLVARVWYHQGVDVLGTERTVLPADGVEFLRALLQPFGFRDYRFRDDSGSGGLPVGGSMTRNGHGILRNGRDKAREKSPVAMDSDCARCAESGSAPHSAHRSTARPAAWRALDADSARF